MPEILTSVPPLKLTIDNSSEADIVTSDRSTTSASPTTNNSNEALRANRENTFKRRENLTNNGQNKKSRKSLGRRNQKKSSSSTKVGSPQKCANVLRLKSQIPRALWLSPSSSSTSFITNLSRNHSPEPNVIVDATNCQALESFTLNSNTTKVHSIGTEFSVPQHQTNNNSCNTLEIIKSIPNKTTTDISLPRQQTSAILNFRIRKSITQMDLRRRHRENNNYQVLAPTQSPSFSGFSKESRALVKNSSDLAGLMGVSSQSSLVNKIFDQNCYYYVIQDRDPKIAGMRIFATIMLNAWRKRRDEVKRLMEEVSDLKRGSVKAKNQLHVFNTLFRVEQKRNDDLSLQLKRSLEDINNTKSSCESLTTSLISLKADKELLEQQIQIKDQEFDGLNALFTQTKSDLFKAMSQQRELQANLSSEQRKVQTLETQKNELINEICEVNHESLLKEEKLSNEVKEKDDALATAVNKIEALACEITDLKEKTMILNNCLEVESRLRKDVANLSREVETLQKCLAATLGNRLRNCLNNSLRYQRVTWQLLHWIAYCTLPATPPPKITTFPFGLSLEKALNIVKR